MNYRQGWQKIIAALCQGFNLFFKLKFLTFELSKMYGVRHWSLLERFNLLINFKVFRLQAL